MKSTLIGIVGALIVAGAMGLGWIQYRDFLTQGQQAPEGVQKLNEMEDQGVPDFEIIEISGKKSKLSDYKDKIVILNFWASWCEPCVQEFPSLLQLIAHFKGDVKLLALSGDYNMDDLTTFLKAFDAKDPNLIVMWDKELEIAKRFGTKVLPESYVLARGNTMARKIAGVDDWYTPQSIAYFNELLTYTDKKPTKGVELMDRPREVDPSRQKENVF